MSSKLERVQIRRVIWGGLGSLDTLPPPSTAINRDSFLQFGAGSNYEADRMSLQRDIARLRTMGQVFAFDARHVCRSRYQRPGHHPTDRGR